MRRFNTTGLCVPESDYMVDISERVAQVRAMVERGDYFCVNRARVDVGGKLVWEETL